MSTWHQSIIESLVTDEIEQESVTMNSASALTQKGKNKAIKYKTYTYRKPRVIFCICWLYFFLSIEIIFKNTGLSSAFCDLCINI